MAKTVIVNAQPRTTTGAGAARKLRATGALPGVVYGPDIEPRSLTLDAHDLVRMLHQHGAHPLVTVKVEGEEILALVKEVQVDAVRQEALHVDFHQVDANKPVQTDVTVRPTGEAAGVKAGGVLDVLTRSVTIEVLPLDIPEAIEIDVSTMQIGDVARVGDLRAPAGVRILNDPEETLATVALPRVEEEGPTLTPEEMEALAALDPEELEALQELAAAAPEVAEGEEGEPTDGDAPADAEGGESEGD